MNNPNFQSGDVWTADNLDVMKGINSECVDLVYLDPPFNSKRDYQAVIGHDGSEEVIAKFKDTWNFSDLNHYEHGELADRNAGVYKVIESAKFTHGKSMMSYLIFMAVRLLEIHRILKETGSVYLHVDPSACHYLKLIMDGIFGKKNYRNEIIWQRNSDRAKGSQHAQKSLGRNHDNILFYTKSNDFVFNGAFIQLDEDEMDKKFPYEDEQGRRYNTSVPIFCSRGQGSRPNLCYEYNGVTNPHPSGWRVKKEKLAEMDANGEIIWREGKRPLRKSFMKDYKGKPIGDIWTDIPNLVGSNKEYEKYPTQKPLALLERILEMSTDNQFVVFDPFCGCATSLVAAEKMTHKNLHWAGCDLSNLAIQLVNERINKLDMFAGIDDKFLCNALTVLPVRTDQGKMPNYRTHKHDLYGKQQGVCNGCGRNFGFEFCEVDHVQPKSRSGSEHVSNLQVLCRPCNSEKGNKTMAEWKAWRVKNGKTIDSPWFPDMITKFNKENKKKTEENLVDVFTDEE